jgi:hypothetical protein
LHEGDWGEHKWASFAGARLGVRWVGRHHQTTVFLSMSRPAFSWDIRLEGND